MSSARSARREEMEMSEEELGYEGLQTRAIHASRPLNSTHAVGSPI